MQCLARGGRLQDLQCASRISWLGVSASLTCMACIFGKRGALLPALVAFIRKTGLNVMCFMVCVLEMQGPGKIGSGQKAGLKKTFQSPVQVLRNS